VFPLGHVGIGTHLVPRRLREGLPWRWLAFGCLLPDVVDKPIWVVAWWRGARAELIDSAKLIGHTAFFAVAVAVLARIVRTRQVVAIAYALPTHILLDVIADAGKGGGLGVWKSWLFWPFEIPRLGILTVASPLHELAMELHSGVYIAGEIMGAALLLWDVARARRPKASLARRNEGSHVNTLKPAPNWHNRVVSGEQAIAPLRGTFLECKPGCANVRMPLI